ncbi:MAG TPA: Rrf2 family transcriptional regulator [bacterium]|jgi:Rrf2 family protein
MISRTGIHAIRALAVLGTLHEGEYAGASTIASRIDAPQNYLGKLLRILSREGLLISQKGMGGGFRLAKPPGEVSLYEVIEPIDNISAWSGCFFGAHECDADNPCVVHDKWGHVRDSYLEFLKNTSIAEITV